ncbi:MAG: DUF6265 family protein [Pseudomonadota bacterium]
MKKQFSLGLVLAVFLGSAQAADITELGWLAGDWQQMKGALDTEEHWITPKGGSMMAINRSTRDGKTVEFEFLRIVERDGKLIYIASPYGRPPVEFPATSVEAGKVVFENPSHDFPTRIIYSAESADVVLARIDGKGRSMAWRFLRMKPAGGQ